MFLQIDFQNLEQLNIFAKYYGHCRKKKPNKCHVYAQKLKKSQQGSKLHSSFMVPIICRM